MTQIRPNSIEQTAELLGCSPGQVPRSIAIIMDGNGRWARQRGLERSVGHERGTKNVRPIVEHAAQLGLEALTLYAFSTENWNRPPAEIETLMSLYAKSLQLERQTMAENDLRFRHVGRREGLSHQVLDELDETVRSTENNQGMFLVLALNYGARAEIIDAVRAIAVEVEAAKLAPADIDEALLNSNLATAGIPDPDLLIRTSGEMRLSNFLLWQLSYAELFVTDLNWPEFDVDAFQAALRIHARRERRFGSIPTR